MHTPRTLLVVGGGRWARVYIQCIAEAAVAVERVVVVSQHGGDLLSTALSAARSISSLQFECVSTLEQAMRDNPVCSVVVNTPRKHTSTATTLLRHGIPVLVEKPVALDPGEGDLLIAAARQAGRALVPALILRHCEYLYNFAARVRTMPGHIVSVTVRWEDPSREMRYGEVKRFDSGLGLPDEVAPHVFTVLEAIMGGGRRHIERAELHRGGLAVRLFGTAAGARLAISLSRDAPERQRYVAVRDSTGADASLDFSAEPGTIIVGTAQLDADPGWGSRPGPLTRQVERFIAAAELPPAESDLESVRGSVKFTSDAAARVREAQKAWLCSSTGKSANVADRTLALREVLVPGLVRAGLVIAGDNAALAARTNEALAVIDGMHPSSRHDRLEQLLADERLTG